MKKFLGLAAFAAVIALPAATLAATYAYVNASGEVASVEAADANTALMTAPNMHVHSGVMLLSEDDDGIVGDSVGSM